MPQYTQICRAAAVLLLLSTGLLAVGVTCLALVAVFGLAFLQQVYAELGQVVPLSPPVVGWGAAAVVAPSLVLVVFYFIVLTRVPSVAVATAGWIASSAFYLGLTLLFVTILSGRVETGSALFSLPIWMLTAFAAGASAYLAVACRRPVAPQPPPMPAAH
ncbi:hypothetical protein DES53_103173 [Roseimicrobium gellanilyticum]|uniref:Uncharacterized protein n=1 Tax=Roseimicrobium gellanilyticum TaxID=748857 RepID=A0A366HNV2_9BACT|nr:hypothetical protein [Roseimicrobium gellanilyticum]RBP45176.1 hypothetical protein DES53_103173 [Roseimicrobium gellanilyticum]